MSNNFRVFNSEHAELSIPNTTDPNDIEAFLTESKAAWLVCGKDPNWNNDDDVVGVRVDHYNDEVHAMIRACADFFFWKLYAVQEMDGREYHAYTNRKQFGISEKAGVIRDPNAPFGWADVSFYGNPIMTATVQKNVKSEMGKPLATSEPAVPQAQAKRHELVSYFNSPQFSTIRIRLAPWTYPYVGVFLAQQQNEDREEAWADRTDRIVSARIQKEVVRPALSEAYNRPDDAGKQPVKAADRPALVFETTDGATIDLWSLPPGRYPVALKNGNGRIDTSRSIQWEGAETREFLVRAAEVARPYYKIHLP